MSSNVFPIRTDKTSGASRCLAMGKRRLDRGEGGVIGSKRRSRAEDGLPHVSPCQAILCPGGPAGWARRSRGCAVCAGTRRNGGSRCRASFRELRSVKHHASGLRTAQRHASETRPVWRHPTQRPRRRTASHSARRATTSRYRLACRSPQSAPAGPSSPKTAW